MKCLLYSLLFTHLCVDCECRIISQAGHSIKSSLQYAYEKEARDDPVFPTRGYVYKLSMELAGLGGDVRFIKPEASVQLNLPLGKIALSWTLKGGLLQSLFENRTPISDRFRLGNATGLRGFSPNGVGPGNSREIHGGNLFYLVGLHTYFRLPFPKLKDSPFFRFHLFANAGSLVSTKDYITSIRDLINTPRVGLGGGIVVKIPGIDIARVELNYCVPMFAHGADRTRKGLQVGINMAF
jgi:outer membrane protein insertion porin family